MLLCNVLRNFYFNSFLDATIITYSKNKDYTLKKSQISCKTKTNKKVG